MKPLAKLPGAKKLADEMTIDSGVGKGVLGTARLYHADVSHYDDRVYPGMLSSGTMVDEWNIRLV